MCNKRWGETPFFEVQETSGGKGCVLNKFGDEHTAREFWNCLREGKIKVTWGGDVRLIEVIEVFGMADHTRHAHTGWQIQDTNHPNPKAPDYGINVIHLTPDAGYIHDAWQMIIDSTGEYKNFKWRGSIRMVRIVAVHK